METVYYTLTKRETAAAGDCMASAAGGPEGRVMCVRMPSVPVQAHERPAPASQDNVIDLAAWKRARETRAGPEDPAGDELEALDVQSAPKSLSAPAETAAPASSRRTARRLLLTAGEGMATLCVILTMILLMLRILAA